jgi:hypothetical protein
MKNMLSRCMVALVAFAASVRDTVAEKVQSYAVVTGITASFVQLNRPYAGYPAGQIVELPASTEAALIASGTAVDSAGPPTTGNVSTTALQGCAAIAAGSSSVTITNPNISKQSIVTATVDQAAADATLLRVERIVPANGSVTIYGTANATATTLIKWAIQNPLGSLTNPQ